MWKIVAAKLSWEIFKGALGKLKSAFGGKKAKITSRTVEIPVPGGRSVKYYERIIEAHISRETVTFVNGGSDSILTSPTTAEPMSKVLAQAGARELEEPEVRSEKIKRSEDAQRLVETAKVKALPEGEKLRFSIFAFIAYGDESFHSNAFSESEKAYRQAYEFAQQLDDKPLQAICLNLIGAAIGNQGKLEETLTLFDEAINLKPGSVEAWYNKGVTLHKLGQHKEALACYDETIKLEPDFAEAWDNKGAILCDELGQIQEAIVCFDRALGAEPTLAEAWYNKGVAFSKLGQHKEALACYDEAIKLKPDDAEAWCSKGMTLGWLGRPKEALACFDKAVKLKHDFADAWRGKGMALDDLGQHKEALSCYDEAIKLKPDFAEAWNNKGVILCDELDQKEEAIACFDSALRVKPTLDEAWHGKGVALYKLGQHKEALTCFDEVIKLKPDDADVWYKKGVTLQRLGLESIKSGDMKEAKERALELVRLKNEAEKDGMARMVDEAMRKFKGGLSKKDLESFEEFEEILKRFKGKKP